ncbi:hypothetical protein ACLK1Z_05580 [Escherichia coli]
MKAGNAAFSFSENSVSALKKFYITARFSLNFFTLGYVKTYRRLYRKISLMSNRLARDTFVNIGVVQASRKITAWLFRV